MISLGHLPSSVAAAQGRAQCQLPGLPGCRLRGRQRAQGEEQDRRQARGDHRQTGQGLGEFDGLLGWDPPCNWG